MCRASYEIGRDMILIYGKVSKVEQMVACQPHKLEVVGSIPTLAIRLIDDRYKVAGRSTAKSTGIAGLPGMTVDEKPCGEIYRQLKGCR